MRQLGQLSLEDTVIATICTKGSSTREDVTGTAKRRLFACIESQDRHGDDTDRALQRTRTGLLHKVLDERVLEVSHLSAGRFAELRVVVCGLDCLLIL